MSASGNTNHTVTQLQQDLQNELITANQLSRLISDEIQQIIHITRPGGELEENIKKNAALVKKIADLHQINIENLPAVTRRQIDMSTNQNVSHEEHNTFRNESSMEYSQ